MDNAQKYKIEDLIEQIERTDKMILFNADNPSRFMTEQWEYRKRLLFNELIQELMNIKDASKYSFKLIYMAINKYYPELIKASANTENNSIEMIIQPKDVSELESVLAA